MAAAKTSAIDINKTFSEFLWAIRFVLLVHHCGAVYGAYLVCFSTDIKTLFFSIVYGYMALLSITAGYHRLWTHRSYKARWPLKLFFCICGTIAGQESILVWSRNHRLHHKFVDTDADPHNINRGFFFAHVGWLISKKHDDVLQKRETIDMEDLLKDPIVRLDHKLYEVSHVLTNFIIPTLVPMYLWHETMVNAFFVACSLRYVVTLNVTFCVNSVGHKFGSRPFDLKTEARENAMLSMFALGEGWHNYHHAFPWDYSTSELGYLMNFTKVFLDIMAACGLAYDFKSASNESVLVKKRKSGDGSRLK